MARFKSKAPLERLAGWLMEQYWSARRAAFYHSEPWRDASRATLERYGRVCMRCRSTGTKHNWICVDHIMSLRRAWHLRLDPDNLQVLCLSCNRWKGSWNDTDFRPRGLTRVRR